MKGLLEWFKSNTKIKRWIFTILVGVVLACFGISKILVTKELGIEDLVQIVISFVIGFTLIVLGTISLQKRTLEVLIEASDDRLKEKKNVNVNSLIFNKKVYEQGPNIVVIGGGTGLNTVLEGLKKYTKNITAIVSVSDYGKKNENDLDILPMDDIKDGIIALSEDQKDMKNLLNYKFNSGYLKGLKFSDVLFSTIAQNNTNFSKAIESTNKILNFTGKVLPVTLDEMEICAELNNGMVIKEKEKIPEIVFQKIAKINRIFVNPTNCRTTPEVVKAIKNADAIVMGPGSLYTNVIPCLLVSGVVKAIKESKAIKIYVNNIMTEQGQTDNYSMADHINAIIDHVGQDIMDFCIYDSGEVVPEYIKIYNKEGSEVVEQDEQNVKGIELIQRNLSYIKDERIRHNPDAVAAAIIEIICDDLKFKDKQNDPKYVMMNAKLKYEKKINKLPKIKKHEKVPNNRKHMQGKQSKFLELYGDRVQSIKNTDENIKRNKLKLELEEKNKNTEVNKRRRTRSKK